MAEASSFSTPDASTGSTRAAEYSDPVGAAKLPVAVGWAAAEARGDDLADDLLPLPGSDGSDSLVARGYAGSRIEADGLDWLVRQLQR